MKVTEEFLNTWSIKKIGVIGPGIVGMPMAALLAKAKIKIGSANPAEVLVIQRNSPSSGWKVDAINSGLSTIGGIEPSLDSVVSQAVNEKLLRASHDYSELKDADVVLVCVQTDKKGFAPDYGPLFESLTDLAEALKEKPKANIPLVIFESTLAPSSMMTLIKDHFKKYGLIEGENILLGNSPNRVMPGRLVERVTTSDKLVAGLNPITPKLIHKLYSNIVTQASLLQTNSTTAEIVKTLENAYRDVRIAFSAEIVRYCDEHGIDFYKVRDEVNKKLGQEDKASGSYNTVPKGGILVPTVGVGGHCLPKDGILLWWRKITWKTPSGKAGPDTSSSIILNARKINDESPSETIKLAERKFGDLSGKKIALLGAAYRFNSEDTRNSPTFALAELLIKKGCNVIIHDPFVKESDQNLIKYNFQNIFTRDFDKTINSSEYFFICTAHNFYFEQKEKIFKTKRLSGLIDACNIFPKEIINDFNIPYTGIGRGSISPDNEFINFVYDSFRNVEIGTANELKDLIDFFNDNYANSEFNKINFKEVQSLAGSCGTGCVIVTPEAVHNFPVYKGFYSRLAQYASKKIINVHDY
jgi:UDP-N-acetyl-D-mannosaminuronic acid dehydrogenase